MKKIKNLKILNNKKVGPDYYLMQLEMNRGKEIIKPGQFFHLKISSKKNSDPLLRRPFSIHNIEEMSDGKTLRIDIIYRIAGRGTEIMTYMKRGEMISTIGPLGNSFTLPENIGDISKENHLWIISGGMGMVPLYYLSRIAAESNKVTVFLGANNDKELSYFERIYSNINITLKLAAVDGSTGFHGTVLDLVESYLEEKDIDNPDYVYTCGPEPMLKAVQKFAENNNIKGEAALEERMGCGIGVCLSCTCKTKSGNKRVCREGPVFNLNEVLFNE